MWRCAGVCVCVCLEVLGDGLWICVLKCNVSYSLKVMWAKTGKKQSIL